MLKINTHKKVKLTIIILMLLLSSRSTVMPAQPDLKPLHASLTLLKTEVTLLSTGLKSVSTKLASLKDNLEALQGTLKPQIKTELTPETIQATIIKQATKLPVNIDDKTSTLMSYEAILEEDKKILKEEEEEEDKKLAKSTQKQKGATLNKAWAGEITKNIHNGHIKQRAQEIRNKLKEIDGILQVPAIMHTVQNLQEIIKVHEIKTKSTQAGKESLGISAINTYANFFNNFPHLLLLESISKLKEMYAFLLSAHINHEDFKTALSIQGNDHALSQIKQLLKNILQKLIPIDQETDLKNLKNKIIPKFLLSTGAKKESKDFMLNDYKDFINYIVKPETTESANFKFTLLESKKQKDFIFLAWDTWVDNLKTIEIYANKYFEAKLNRLFDEKSLANNQQVLNTLFTTLTDNTQDWYTHFLDKITEKRNSFDKTTIDTVLNFLAIIDKQLLAKERFDKEKPGKIKAAQEKIKEANALPQNTTEQWDAKKAAQSAAKDLLDEAKQPFLFNIFDENDFKTFMSFATLPIASAINLKKDDEQKSIMFPLLEQSLAVNKSEAPSLKKVLEKLPLVITETSDEASDITTFILEMKSISPETKELMDAKTAGAFRKIKQFLKELPGLDPGLNIEVEAKKILDIIEGFKEIILAINNQGFKVQLSALEKTDPTAIRNIATTLWVNDLYKKSPFNITKNNWKLIKQIGERVGAMDKDKEKIKKFEKFFTFLRDGKGEKKVLKIELIDPRDNQLKKSEEIFKTLYEAFDNEEKEPKPN